MIYRTTEGIELECFSLGRNWLIYYSIPEKKFYMDKTIVNYANKLIKEQYGEDPDLPEGYKRDLRLLAIYTVLDNVQKIIPSDVAIYHHDSSRAFVYNKKKLLYQIDIPLTSPFHKLNFPTEGRTKYKLLIFTGSLIILIGIIVTLIFAACTYYFPNIGSCKYGIIGAGLAIIGHIDKIGMILGSDKI